MTATRAPSAPETSFDGRWLLVLGSNVDADHQLDRALAGLSELAPLLRVSARLPSPAADTESAPAYLNQAVLLRTALSFTELKGHLRALETALGRVRPAPRPGWCAIDIDLVASLDPEPTIWDTKSWSASYAQAVIGEVLGK